MNGQLTVRESRMAYKCETATFSSIQSVSIRMKYHWNIKTAIWRHRKMTKDRQKLKNRRVHSWKTLSTLGKNGEFAVFLRGALTNHPKSESDLTKRSRWHHSEQQSRQKFKGEILEAGEPQKGWDLASKLCSNPWLTDKFPSPWVAPGRLVKKQAETRRGWIC